MRRSTAARRHDSTAGRRSTLNTCAALLHSTAACSSSVTWMHSRHHEWSTDNLPEARLLRLHSEQLRYCATFSSSVFHARFTQRSRAAIPHTTLTFSVSTVGNGALNRRQAHDARRPRRGFQPTQHPPHPRNAHLAQATDPPHLSHVPITHSRDAHPHHSRWARPQGRMGAWQMNASQRTSSREHSSSGWAVSAPPSR